MEWRLSCAQLDHRRADEIVTEATRKRRNLLPRNKIAESSNRHEIFSDRNRWHGISSLATRRDRGVEYASVTHLHHSTMNDKTWDGSGYP